MSERKTEKLFRDLMDTNGYDISNGITEYVGQEPEHPGGMLSVSRNGTIGEAFFQPVPFLASDDVHVFYPRFDMSPEVGIFIAAIIRKEKYRYNYGRKWGLDRMRASKMMLPALADGSPDFAAMAKIVADCPSSAILALAATTLASANLKGCKRWDDSETTSRL